VGWLVHLPSLTTPHGIITIGVDQSNLRFGCVLLWTFQSRLPTSKVRELVVTDYYECRTAQSPEKCKRLYGKETKTPSGRIIRV
jgi:hypothetical protein